METFFRFDRIREHILFVHQFIKQPVITGAIAPSSQWLAELMTEDMRLHEADTIVELGAGTGSFTRAITRKANPKAVVLAIEANRGLAERLRTQFSRVVIVNDSAERLPSHLAAVDRVSADCIICGLPWAGFSREHQERLMTGVTRAMRPGARFATFAYPNAAWLPPGRRLRALLHSSFRKVTTTRTEWRNMPPAFVYRCEK
jgi:phospholipid N-methyltransferase